jgi:hypothetical protein
MKVSCQLHASAALPPDRSLQYPLDRRLGGPKRRSARCGEEKTLAPARIQTPTVQPVARRYTG